MAKRDNHYEAAFEAYLQRRRTSYVAVDEARRSPLAEGSLKSLDFIVSPAILPTASPAVLPTASPAIFPDVSPTISPDVSLADAPGAGPPVRWLVDVKGRRFPSGRQKRYWKNWLTREDLRSMAQWERLLGPQFGGLYVFAYNIVGDRSPVPTESLFEFRSRVYAFVAIRFADYARLWRPLSSSWDTVAIRTRWFRAWALPFEAFLDKPAAGNAGAHGVCAGSGGAEGVCANGVCLEGARADGLRGEALRGDGLRGDSLRGDGLRGGGLRGDGAASGARFPEAPDDVICDLFTPAGW